jgi:hypothetical protein
MAMIKAVKKASKTKGFHPFIDVLTGFKAKESSLLSLQGDSSLISPASLCVDLTGSFNILLKSE